MATAAAVKEEPATRFAKEQLKAIIERIERLEEEKKTISEDIRDVFAEAKGNGYDVKALRTTAKRDGDEKVDRPFVSRDPETLLPRSRQANVFPRFESDQGKRRDVGEAAAAQLGGDAVAGTSAIHIDGCTGIDVAEQ